MGLAPNQSRLAEGRSHAINIRDILPAHHSLVGLIGVQLIHESLAAGSRVLDLHFQKNTIVFRSIHAPVIAAARRVGNIGKELGHSQEFTTPHHGIHQVLPHYQRIIPGQLILAAVEDGRQIDTDQVVATTGQELHLEALRIMHGDEGLIGRFERKGQ